MLHCPICKIRILIIPTSSGGCEKSKGIMCDKASQWESLTNTVEFSRPLQEIILGRWASQGPSNHMSRLCVYSATLTDSPNQVNGNVQKQTSQLESIDLSWLLCFNQSSSSFGVIWYVFILYICFLSSLRSHSFSKTKINSWAKILICLFFHCIWVLYYYSFSRGRLEVLTHPKRKSSVLA